MTKQFMDSCIYFEKEGTYRQIMHDQFSCQLDNFTDSVMIETAYYNDEEGILKNAMSASMLRAYDDYSPQYSLLQYGDYLNGKNVGKLVKVAYARYWHGYLLILKPLLCVFDYGDIRMGNMFVQLLLLTCIICLLHKRVSDCVLPFILGIFILTPIVLPLSLQFSTCFYISVIAGIVLLWKDEKIIGKYENLYFLIIGMCTSYFDFLTYPIVTFAFPLLILIVMKKQEWQKSVRDEIVYGLHWCLGYVGQWAGKWILGSVILNENIMRDAIDQIGFRSGTGQDITYAHVLWENVAVFLRDRFHLLLALAFVLVAIFQLIQGIKGNKIKEMIKLNIPVILIALIPFIWYFMTQNHSDEHFWFTSRDLAISVFAISCCFVNNRNLLRTKN